MLSRLKHKANKAWLNINARGILSSPPVRCRPDSSLIILSQTYHPDLLMYLLAVKTFARYIQPRLFVIVDDGLTANDQAVLRSHLGNVRFVPTASVDRGPCPSGGAWERLLTIAGLTADDYVIQLDADTLTLSPPDEVAECIAQNRPFTLGTDSGQVIVSVDKAQEYASQWEGAHVQNRAERNLAAIKGFGEAKYVRGCAGFAGFPKGREIRADIESFSTQMEQLLGRQKWGEWGSEQVTSNFIISNMPDAAVLSTTRYPFWAPGIDIGQSSLVHFFGTFRFTGGMYVRQARRVCRELVEGTVTA